MNSRKSQATSTVEKRREDYQKVLNFLKEKLSPDIFNGLRFSSKKLSMNDAKKLVKALDGS